MELAAPPPRPMEHGGPAEDDEFVAGVDEAFV